MDGSALRGRPRAGEAVQTDDQDKVASPLPDQSNSNVFSIFDWCNDKVIATGEASPRLK
jgi:hypothetical protein